ncbi:MAG: DUF2029 domain-containing protein [Bradymonadales bacterium]|nr:DUF2029 domain-containing protein [Bradymonadales bacterium]
MKPCHHQVVAPLVELAVVLLLGFEILRQVADLTPLARHFFGFEGGPPAFAMADPLYPMLRGILALLLLIYVIRVAIGHFRSSRTDAAAPSSEEPGPDAGKDWLLTLVIWILIVLATVTPAARDMFDRAMVDQAPGNQQLFRSRTHDGGVLQTELAMEAVVAGRNPYDLDYGDTVMARARDSDPTGWRRLGFARNPALAHVPYLPAMFLLPLGPKWLSERLFDWYDQRVFYLVAAFLFVWFSGRLVAPGRGRRLVWLLTGPSPLVLPFLRIGRNDILLLSMLAALAWAVRRDRAVLAGGILGLACATKQFAWAMVPFFAIWVFLTGDRSSRRRYGSLAALLVVMAAFCLPFFLDSPRSFLDDILLFNLGMTEEAFPLRPDSLGIASVVLGAGWARSLRAPFPLWIFQLVVTLPLVLLMGWRLVRHPTGTGLFLAGAVTVFCGLFFSRFFDFSYMAIPFYLLLFAALLAPPLGVGQEPMK